MKKILFIGVLFFLCSISVFSQSKMIWKKTQSLNSISAYENFLMKYPNGEYKELARQKLYKLRQEELLRKERKERFIELFQQNINNIRIGITLNQVDSILKLTEGGYNHPFRWESSTNTWGAGSYCEEYLIEDYLYLKFENDKLSKFLIIKL